MNKTNRRDKPAKAATHMRFEWERALLQSDLDAQAKAMALILATYADAKGLAFPSLATLAKNATLSPVRTRCLLHELAREKWIDITFGGGESKTNRYWLNIPKDAGVKFSRETGKGFARTLKNDLRFKWEIEVRDSNLNFAQKGTALLLATYETNLAARPTIKELADSSTRSRRHLQRLLSEVAEDGWLQITVRRRHESNVYFLTSGQRAEHRPAQNTGAPGDETDEKTIAGIPSPRGDTGKHSEMTPAIVRSDTGKSQTPLLTPITTTPIRDVTSNALRREISKDERGKAKAILGECDSILGPYFANDRRAMKDKMGMARMIAQLLDGGVPERAIINELTEGGYPNFTHPASGMYKRLERFVNRPHVDYFPVLPVAPDEAVLKVLADVAETMRDKTNQHLGANGRRIQKPSHVWRTAGVFNSGE